MPDDPPPTEPPPFLQYRPVEADRVESYRELRGCMGRMWGLALGTLLMTIGALMFLVALINAALVFFGFEESWWERLRTLLTVVPIAGLGGLALMLAGRWIARRHDPPDDKGTR